MLYNKNLWDPQSSYSPDPKGPPNITHLTLLLVWQLCPLDICSEAVKQQGAIPHLLAPVSYVITSLSEFFSLETGAGHTWAWSAPN